MKHSRLWVLTAIIGFAVLLVFVLSVPRTRDVGQLPTVLSSTPTSTPNLSFSDAFKKGVHTITGSIEVPNACTSITTNSSLLGEASSTTGILIDIAIPVDSGICLQIPTEVDFTTKITAPADLPIQVNINGEIATTTAP